MEGTRGVGGANQRVPGLSSERAPVQFANGTSNELEEIENSSWLSGGTPAKAATLNLTSIRKVRFNRRPVRDRIRTIAH